MTDPGSNNDAAHLTLIMDCPVCGCETGEPIGVTGTQDGTPHAAVLVRCAVCNTVYGGPRPRANSNAHAAVPGYRLGRRGLTLATANLRPGSRIRCDDAATVARLQALSDSWIVDLASDRATTDPDSSGDQRPLNLQYDLVILSRSLQETRDPHALFAGIRAMLAVDGRVVLVLGNLSSSCFATFGGRHWCGYDVPSAMLYPHSDAVRRLATRAGLRVCAATPRFAPSMWLESLRNGLRDWQVSALLARVIAGRWGGPGILAAMTECIAVMRGKGGMLVIELEMSK